VADNGLPNCIVVSARLPRGAGVTGDQIVDCERCDNTPGLEPFVAPVPLERIGTGLSNYACLCAVSPLASGLPCPAEDSSSASWCYSETPPGPLPNSCAPRPGPILGFSGPALVSGTLYVACFDPQTGQ